MPVNDDRPKKRLSRLGIRGRLFLVSIAIIAVTVVVLDAYVSSTLRAGIEERLAGDMRVRSQLVARSVALRPAGASWPEVANELGRESLARVTLVARDGRVLGDSEVAPADLAHVENHEGRPEIRDALATGSGSASRSSATIHHALLYVAARVDGGGPVAVVRLATSLELVDAAVARVRQLSLVGTGFAVAVAALLSSLSAHLLSRSIREVQRAASAMVTDLSVRTRRRGDDEIGALGEALDGLADDLSGSLERLESEKGRLEAILQTMGDGVLVLDPSSRVVMANPAVLAMLGASGPVEGRQPIEIVRSAELADVISKVAREQSAAATEIELGGLAPRRLAVRVAPLTSAGARGVVAVLSDVTGLRRLETMRREFVANVSHELRTPIAAIRAATETLEGGALDDPEAAREFVGIVSRHARRLNELVEDLLALSRIEAHKLELAPERLEAESFLRSMVELHAHAAARAGVTLERAQGDAALSIFADRRALEQAVSNLVDNAIKYSSGGATVTLRAEPSGADDVRLSVSDTGPGIAATHLPRLFERFYRVDRGRSREVGGTGLGLAIVKHLAEAMGGSVGVASELGRGSTFALTLPRRGADGPARPTHDEGTHDGDVAYAP